MDNPLVTVPSNIPRVMGIVNVTPDSFFDGGRYSTFNQALSRIETCVAEGASIIDIGGCSSRPGAEIIDEIEESARVIPVVRAAAKRFKCAISVDTTNAQVAREALDAGATWINDVSTGRFDSTLRNVVAVYDATIVLMHSRGTPATMQSLADYNDVVTDSIAELTDLVKLFEADGVKPEKIVIDPGIGFAKTALDNIEIMTRLSEYRRMGFPVLLGTSRKSFLGTITEKPAEERLAASLATVARGYGHGVAIFRVHDVGATIDMLKVLAATESTGA